MLGGSTQCDECKRFEHASYGLLVRAFECNMSTTTAADLGLRPNADYELRGRFFAPRDGARLLDNATAAQRAHFESCGRSELSLGARDATRVRPASALRADVSDGVRPTYASNFGLTLSPPGARARSSGGRPAACEASGDGGPVRPLGDHSRKKVERLAVIRTPLRSVINQQKLQL